MKTATIGSVSHGTHQPADLVVSFADALRDLDPTHERLIEADAVQTLWSSGWTDVYESPHIFGLLEDLEEALSEYAPPYCRFGAHDGDGSDYGFWPDTHEIDDLPRVSDPSEVEALGGDCCFVNDHGNVTVYGGDGSVLLEIV